MSVLPAAAAVPGRSTRSAPLSRQPGVLRKAGSLEAWGWRLAGYVLLLGGWTFASGRLMEAYLLPTPWAILARIYEELLSGELVEHFAASLAKIAIGFVLSFVIGTAIGILMRRRWWHAFFQDPVVGAFSTPSMIFALVTAMVFGLSYWGPVVAIVITTFPFVTINVLAGIKALPRDLIDMAGAYGVSEWRKLRHIIVPHLAPYTFTAARYGFATTWKVTALTEIFGGSSGIGFMMRNAFQNFDMTGMLAWIVSFFLFALFIEKVILQQIETWVFRWRKPAVGAA